MKKISEAVLAPHKHMSKKASPHHAHSMGLVYTPSGKEEIRPIDTADAGYGGEAVADAEGGEANPGRASKKAVSPMKMQTLVKKTANEETERERLKRLRSFAYQQRLKGLGNDIHEPIYEEAPPGMEDWIKSAKPSFKKQYGKDWEKVLYATAWKKHNEMKEEASPMIKPPTSNIFYKKSDAFAHAKKHGGEVHKRIYTNSLTGRQSISYQVKEEVELDERNMENKAKKDNVTRQIGTAAYIQHGADAGSAKMTGREVMRNPKMKSKDVAKLYRELPIKEASSNGPEEENDMAMTQLHFIKYAAEEIMDAIQVGTDMEEWYQNKLTKAHMIMEGLHSYMEGRKRHYGSLGDPVYEGKVKNIATNKAEDERLAKLKAMAKKPQPKSAPPPQRVGTVDKVIEEEVWDKPMPDSKKKGSLTPEQKAKAKARAKRAGRPYPNKIDNMWASEQ